MILAPGTLLGPYEIVAAIEAGGMGSVFRALDTRLRREVALKVLPVSAMLDESLVRRFEREARAAAALTHPNIVAVYDVGEADVRMKTPLGIDDVRVRFLVEEFVEGCSLRRLIRNGNPSVGTVLEVATGIARGLLAAHEKGLIHRDLKPENILIDRSGTAKIADFGLVRWIYPDTSTFIEEPDSLTRTGFVVGTLGYMSPEQAKGDAIGPGSDIFVFGTLLYELITGVSPFARPNADEAFRAVLKMQPPSILDRAPDTPSELVEVVERCLEKDAGVRYASAAQVLRDLDRFRRTVRLDEGGNPIRADGAAPSAVRARTSAAVPALWLAAALAIVVAFAGGWAIARSTSPTAVAAPVNPLSVRRAELWRAEWRAEVCADAARDHDAAEAVLTPDGAHVVFTVATANGDESDVFVAPTSGSTKTLRLSTDAAGGRAPYAARDGRALFSSARVDRFGGIWDVPIEGNEEPRQLVEEGMEPALSPDESQLVYVNRKPDGGSELWLARRDGLFRRKLLSTPDTEWRNPAFTANGTAVLVHEVRRAPMPQPGSSSLGFIPLAAPRLMAVTEARRLDPRSRPSAMPDGSALVVTFDDHSPYLMQPRGRGLQRMPFGAALVSFFASRDGRTALTRSEGGPFILWRAR